MRMAAEKHRVEMANEADFKQFEMFYSCVSAQHKLFLSLSPCGFVISVRAQQVGQMIPRFSLNEMIDDCRPFTIVPFGIGDCQKKRERQRREKMKNRCEKFPIGSRMPPIDYKLFLPVLGKTFSFASMILSVLRFWASVSRRILDSSVKSMRQNDHDLGGGCYRK